MPHPVMLTRYKTKAKTVDITAIISPQICCCASSTVPCEIWMFICITLQVIQCTSDAESFICSKCRTDTLILFHIGLSTVQINYSKCSNCPPLTRMLWTVQAEAAGQKYIHFNCAVAFWRPHKSQQTDNENNVLTNWMKVCSSFIVSCVNWRCCVNQNYSASRSPLIFHEQVWATNALYMCTIIIHPNSIYRQYE